MDQKSITSPKGEQLGTGTKVYMIIVSALEIIFSIFMLVLAVQAFIGWQNDAPFINSSHGGYQFKGVFLTAITAGIPLMVHAIVKIWALVKNKVTRPKRRLVLLGIVTLTLFILAHITLWLVFVSYITIPLAVLILVEIFVIVNQSGPDDAPEPENTDKNDFKTFDTPEEATKYLGSQTN